MSPCQLILIFSDANRSVDPHRGGRENVSTQSERERRERQGQTGRKCEMHITIDHQTGSVSVATAAVPTNYY